MPVSLTVLEWVAAVVFVVGAGAFVVDHKQIVAWIDAHTTRSERQAFESAITVLKPLAEGAVLWAEHFGPVSGIAKFATAVGLIVSELNAKGISLDIRTIEAAVQAAFSAAKQSGTLSASAPSTAPVTSATPNAGVYQQTPTANDIKGK